MKTIKLFGNHVMVKSVAKDQGIQLHLPDKVKDETKAALFDTVVDCVGDEVTRVKEGDIVMAHVPQGSLQPHPVTGQMVAIIQEGMIQGVVREELNDGMAVHREPEGKWFDDEGQAGRV